MLAEIDVYHPLFGLNISPTGSCAKTAQKVMCHLDKSTMLIHSSALPGLLTV